jgi:hypothetical protein
MFTGMQNKMRDKIHFWKWKTTSDQIEQENQEYFNNIHTQFDGILSNINENSRVQIH